MGNITLPDLSEGCVSHHSLHQVSDIASEAVWRLAIIQRARLKCVFYWPSNVRMFIITTYLCLADQSLVCPSPPIVSCVDFHKFMLVHESVFYKSCKICEWHNQSAGGLNQEFSSTLWIDRWESQLLSPFASIMYIKRLVIKYWMKRFLKVSMRVRPCEHSS